MRALPGVIALQCAPRSSSATLAAACEAHLQHLADRHYAETTCAVRAVHLWPFCTWARAHGVTEPRQLTQSILDAYRRHLSEYRKPNDTPLSLASQHARLTHLRVWCAWLARDTYDALNRLATRTDPLSRTETFTYDLTGNLASTTDRKNQTTAFTYDALNRKTQASYADATTAPFTYDAGSRITQVNDTADPHRPITFTYDPLDRVLTETTSLGTVTYTYDTAGRRTSMTVAGQSPVTNTYDHNARLRTITQAPLGLVDPSTLRRDRRVDRGTRRP